MSFKVTLLAAVFGLATAGLASTAKADTWTLPTLTNNAATTVPNFVITFNADGSIVTSGPGGTYDGADDTYIEFVNNTGHQLTSLNLSANTNIFGFDNDGIDSYIANFDSSVNTADNTGYGGYDAYFTNYTSDNGTVNFLGTGIDGNGGVGYFSLEEALSINQVANLVPEPASMAAFAAGLAGLAMMRRRRAV
jgi:hypothetical protein